MTTKFDWLTARPIAHRGLHDINKNIYENTLSACRAAIDGNFSIEVDLHLSGDGTPVVFHDLSLQRMCADPRKVRQLDTRQLRDMRIGQSLDHIPTLAELLQLTDGKVGLVLELKGVVGEDEGFVEQVAKALSGYQGPAVIMSFSHWLVKDARNLAPQLPLGLVARGDERQYASHKMIADKCDVDFVSYDIDGLPCKFSQEFRSSGKPLICWTVEDAGQMKKSLKYSDQITFENFDPDNVKH
ncbi:MAG: glycerophosphodiester phosphodiesterase [Hyphomicrobiales bacterium]|nr:glycerophosphodiester phosphodiesterase [Hyphomicrobiales bacterium]